MDTPLTLYNTLTRKKEAFEPIRKGEARMYSCGPTVYWFAHIGNLRSFLFADLLRRTLAYDGYEVKFVMNITDVGHLTDDGSEGEDKILVAMRREGKTAYEIAGFYTEAFLRDMQALDIKEPDRWMKATEHIDAQIAMIRKLEENGFTYATSDGIYFDTSKLEGYGRLSGQAAEDKMAGARVEMGEKRNATDFALWKFSPEGPKRDMEWDSPWGTGFPGWHIECSAMSAEVLGIPFDIHTGGVDHIPVHHENEIAQVMGAEGTLQANYWLHGEFLTVDGGKMSKSLGNLYTLADLEERSFDPLAFRYFCLQAHYRTKLNFTWEALEAAGNALKNLRHKVMYWEKPSGSCPEHEQRFLAAVRDDLDMPAALSVVWDMADSGCPDAAKAASLIKFDRILGLGLAEHVANPPAVPSEVQEVLDDRAKAREEKDWERSDALRDEIKSLGYEVEDTALGPRVYPA